jgi:AcrR family transcriptional regulator
MDLHMPKDTQSDRAKRIEDAAFALVAEKGFLNMSMLAVAKSAKASNETLYRWYGDKLGLFEALVKRNTDKVKTALDAAVQDGVQPFARLETIGPVLLAMVQDERAVSLNRAAAADATGRLGQALASGGREVVFPLIRQTCAEAIDANELGGANTAEIAQTYLTLLIGDVQIRRAIGVLDPLSPEQINSRSDHAAAVLKKLYPAAP